MNKYFSKKSLFFLICLISLILLVNSDSNTKQDDIQSNAQYPKAVILNNGNVLVLTSEEGTPQITHVAELDKDGRLIYNDAKISRGFTADAQLTQPTNNEFHIFTHHNKQNVAGADPSEYLVTFDSKAKNVNAYVRKQRQLYTKSSLVPLKNGRIFLAGIIAAQTFGAQATIAEVVLFNPTTKTFSSGQTINSAYSKYIHCYEQSDNEVYCIYVSYEDEFISKLKLKHYTINNDIIVGKKEYIIKNFYTEFNFLKAVTYNSTDALILFQTGNPDKTKGKVYNGRDLYYYNLRVNPEDDTLFVARYEYLYPGCKFRSDPEDYNADIAVFSLNRIYIVCESDDNNRKLKGFEINPNRVEITEFYLNNFSADDIRYPIFAKFGQNLGLIYTYTNENGNKKVSYQIMNFPYCEEKYRQNPLLIPKNRVKEINFRAVLMNPYPANRANEEVNIRLKPFTNITIRDSFTNEEIKANVDYPENNEFKIMPKDISGIYDIEYIATRNDNKDGLIIGKTCSIKINTPECLERCDSCTEKGNEEHHKCLGCNPNGRYYYESDPDANISDYGMPHNCPNCNISCDTCYGEFLKEIPTTNCKLCDYDNNYFHYEKNEKTCISNETKKYWESVIGSAIYLDKTPGPDKKHLWRWKHCHKNCAECFEAGTDANNKCTMCRPGYYFYCNQTEENGGIAGSCNNVCPNNGFYVTTKEKGRQKCCPCIDHCKECSNSTHCDKCYQPFFKTNNGMLCNESCGYCLAEDRNLWECVNCKTRYGSPRYTLNKTCVSEIPFISFLKRYHHIIDDTCNLLIGCKEGCHKCDPWYSDKCTECSSNYYKEDHTGDNPMPKTFRCFDDPTCKGITPYIHDRSLRIGGVPVQNWLNQGNLCLNCRRYNNSYRWPEDQFFCGDKKYRTFIDIDDYHKLSYCYTRCASCNDYGNGVIMNCTKCRDPSLYVPSYEIFNISLKNSEGMLKKLGTFNCYRKPPKCGIFPFYHDYDLGDKLGLEDCGEQCDICLYNMTCPEHLPFYVFSTRECVEYCGMELFTNSCTINNQIGVNTFMDNPWRLHNPFDLLNNSATLNEIISLEIFSMFDLTTIKKDIHNYFGNGQIYNLQESHLIISNNFTIEVSSVDLELKKISKLLKGEEVKSSASILDLSQCENILKKKYGLSNEESLILLKGDFLDQIPDRFLTNKVAYQLFSTSIGAFLPLIDCKEADTSVNILSIFNSSNLLGSLSYKIGSATEDNLNVFDPKSPFYNDICTPFTNENGNDVLLNERRLDYFNENYNLCENGCRFKGYNETIKRYTCECQIKTSSGDTSNYENVPMEIPEDFYKQDIGYSNIRVFKCASQVFSGKGQKLNWGSYILLACFTALIGMIVLYYLKDKNNMESTLDNLNKRKGNVKNNIYIDKEIQEQKKYYEDINGENNPNKDQLSEDDFTLKEDQLNFGDYDQVKDNDTRSPLKMFWSFLKHKQLILFTFYTPDKNSKSLKISLFILFISFYLAFTALFFNDNIMRSIYIYKGNTDAAVHVTNIVLSSICSLIMSIIVRLVALNDRDISKIISEKEFMKRYDSIELTKRSLKIRSIILFAFSVFVVGICWYYVSAFCAVFKNSQGHYLINTLVAFIVCNLWPFVTSAITMGIRKLSLNKKSPGLYKLSKIISVF